MMIRLTTARIAAFGLAALALTTAPIEAATQSATTTASYLIESVFDRGDGTLTANELLTIVSANGQATVTVKQQGSGETASVTAPIDAHGIVNVTTSDPALTCYNNAQGIIANSARPQPGAALAMTLAGSAFAVPINVASARAANGMREFTFGGSVEAAFDAAPQQSIAVIVDGAVQTQHNILSSVRLRETTEMVATHAALGQSTCSISRVIDAPQGLPA
jgi:hypothetical protein